MNTKEIQDWLVAQVAELLHTDPATIDIRISFANYGLSSRDVVTLSGDLEELLGRRLPPTLAYEHPSILALARFLGEEGETQEPATGETTSAGFSNEPVAIIGMGCRFPGAPDPESFWQLLSEGGDAIREIPDDRWPKEVFYHPDPSIPGKATSRWGGFLDGIDQFDPFFFGISPKEAKYMDPQQRLLLELSHEALDDAGQTQAGLDGTKTGVFVGISINEYSHFQFEDPLLITSHSGTGNALSIAANRISYFYNLRGPSIAIDTACSSSLTAVHLACQSLRNGECRMALAGGVNMILSPAHSIAFSKAGVLAPDGRCKTFDAGANGYVRGEGGGMIVLKPLSAALAEGDPVLAVILGSAIAQDGRTNGLMAPSQESQETLLREACQTAGVAPQALQYVEAHGTGTLLGDSMEAGAIGAVMGAGRTQGTCAIGSVKTNIGHLEAAAGIAGLIKVVLSLQHRTIPPSIHFHSPNPHIPFEALHLQVNDVLRPWPADAGTALAGVSSFGFGGTNVHLVVSEADPYLQERAYDDQIDPVSSLCHLLPLSANSEETLRSLTGRLEEWLGAGPSATVSDICRAAGARRSPYNHRLAVLGYSGEELRAGLQAFLMREPDPNLLQGGMIPDRLPKLAFVFPGQGGQWFGMGRELLKQEPVFHQAIEQVHRVVQARFGWSLMDVLLADQPASRLDEIDRVQPALFAIQVALTALWRSWGIVPDAVVGHSMGEVAAAHVAGILSLEDAVQVICGRSQLMKAIRGRGSMLVTELRPDQAREWLKGYEDQVTIAVVNSPASTVLSGDTEAVREVMASLEHQNLFCKLVNVDVASHSPQMDQLRDDLLATLAGLRPQRARIPVYSTVTGSRGEELVFDAEYWMDNLRETVLFSDAVGQLLDDGHTVFVEIGPHPILLGALQQSIQIRQLEARLLPSLRREEPEREVMLRALGALYLDGFSISWDKLYTAPGRHVRLPSIPWERQRYWLDTRPAAARAGAGNAHPLLGHRLDLANAPSFVWQTALDPELLRFLEDHRIEEAIVLPASAYIEMALQAAEEAELKKNHVLADLIFRERLVLETGKPRTVQVLITPGEEDRFSFAVYSRTNPGEDWILNATAAFLPQQAADAPEAAPGLFPVAIRQQGPAVFSPGDFYRHLQERGIQYGPDFRSILEVWGKGSDILGRVSLPGSLQYDAGRYQMHPAMLDACLQVLAASTGGLIGDDLFLPAGCERIRFFSKPGREVWSQVLLRSEPLTGAELIEADIRIWDEKDQPVAELAGVRLQRTRKRNRPLLYQRETWLYHLRWQLQEEPEPSAVPSAEKRQWLIFADDEGHGEELARQLEAGGDNCRLLRCGETLKRLEKAPGALSAIIEQFIGETPAALYGIVHLWSISMPSPSLDVNGSMGLMQMLGCNSVLYLVQALARRPASMPRLWLVTQGALSVRAGEAIAAEQSALWGLGKVISFELPELKCVRVDLDPDQDDAGSVPILLRQLSLEDREDQIAFRGEDRFVLRLLPFRTGSSATCPAVTLRKDGAYLITGGLGGLGLATAKWMVERGARHLVLLGRSAPSPEVMRVLEQLQEGGAEVVVAHADVSDPDHIEQVFQNIEQNMPELRGVVHAAGVLDDGALLNLDRERMKKVMAPKVEGTWNLHRATADLSLDFFVMYSSAVSVLGSPGQGNYTAASTYLDAMAHYRHHLGLPAISINWGPWAEVGLAAEATERLTEQNASTQHLVKVIGVEQGLEMLELLLSETAPQVAVLPFDLKNLLELYPAAAAMPFFADVGGSETHVARLYARPNLRQEYIAPRNELERKLAELWRQTLHIDRIGVRDSFFELGGDSVLAAQILSLAQKTFGIRINPQDAFQAFTIEKLAEMLEAEIISRIEEMSEEEAERLLSKKK